VYEVDVQAQRVRRIELPLAPGLLSYKDAADVNMYFVPTSGIVPVERGLLLAFGNGRPWDSPLGEETAAVTYALSCPPSP
jgi:hypothetical protein